MCNLLVCISEISDVYVILRIEDLTSQVMSVPVRYALLCPASHLPRASPLSMCTEQAERFIWTFGGG